MAITYNPLWKTLVDRNMNKEDLRKLTNISPSTMAKMSKDEYVALRVIDDICKALQVKSISHVVEYLDNNPQYLMCDYLDALENEAKIIIRNKPHEEEASYNDQKSLYDLSTKVINELINNPDKNRLDRYIKVHLQYIDYKLLSGGYMLNLIQMLSLIDQDFK